MTRSGITLLNQALEDLGSASDSARLQLHLLALEARQRGGEVGAQLESIESRLDRGLHQALATAADKAHQLSKSVQESLRGHPPVLGPVAERIGSFMTQPVHVCSPDEPLSRAAQLMWDHDCGCVPVVDAEGQPVGMLTDRDICMAAYTKGAALHTVRVGDVMSQHVRSCSVDDPLERAIGVMAEAQVRRLPVLDTAGRVVGMLSLGDISRAAALLGKQEADRIVHQLLMAVSRRRGTDASAQLAAE